MILGAAAVNGCDDEDVATRSQGVTAVTAERLCKALRGESHAGAAAAIRERFVATSDQGPRLLLSQAEVRPGQQFVAAVVNDRDHELLYGYGYELERAVDGEWRKVRGTPKAFIAVGLTAEPGDVGHSCVPVSVPSTAPPGGYRVMQDGIVPGTFRVAGEPLLNPLWERSEALADRLNRLKPNSAQRTELERRIADLLRRANQRRRES